MLHVYMGFVYSISLFLSTSFIKVDIKFFIPNNLDVVLRNNVFYHVPIGSSNHVNPYHQRYYRNVKNTTLSLM